MRYEPAVRDLPLASAPQSGAPSPKTAISFLDQETRDQAYEQLGRLAASPDRAEKRLGQALARLPEVQDGLNPAEARAVIRIAASVRRMNREERGKLEALLKDRAGSGLLNVALQGALWMVTHGAPARSALAQRPRELIDYAYAELAGRLTTPEQILDFMTRNFIYRLDLDRVKSRREFFESRQGDCSEYSLLAGHLLAALGFEVRVLMLRPSAFYGHVALIYKDGRGVWLMDPSRAALARMLPDKADSPVMMDRLLWAEVKGFDRLFGPSPDPADLIRRYDPAGREPPLHRLLPYEVYRRHVETHGAEDAAWLKF